MDNDEMLSQLNTLNLSFNTLIFVVFAIILNMYYIDGQRNALLDNINGTTNAQNTEDLAKLPSIANKILTITASIFLFIGYSAFENVKESGDEIAIQNQFKRFISAMLVLVATVLSSANLEV